MTRKEIIRGLKFTVEMFLFDPITGAKYTEPRCHMDKIIINSCKAAIELLKHEPDDTPQKSGKWIPIPYELDYKTDAECSLCHGQFINAIRYDFCPYCGARMEADND